MLPLLAPMGMSGLAIEFWPWTMVLFCGVPTWKVEAFT
jgi:hypothetical protein